MIDFTNFEKSLKHLDLQAGNYALAKGRPELTSLDQEALAESVIHRFETCYDSMWKVLKRYLIDVLGLSDVPNSPKPIFKLAAKNNMLGESLDKFLKFADVRISTTHDYSEEKAKEALIVVPEFIQEAKKLFEFMVNKND